MGMDLLWSPHKLKQKVRKNMKHFSPLQIAALAVLTVIVVALAIVAFVTGKNHAADTVDISHPTTTPEVFKIEIAGDTNTPSPVPIPMSTATLTAFPSASPTSSAKPSSGKQSDTFFTLTIGGNDITVG